MKILIVIFGLLAWVSCDDEKIERAEMIEADAVWSNQLAADGCSWHFSVTSDGGTVSLVPTDGSLKVIEEALGKNESYYSFTDVHLTYRPTGSKKDVKCGWGKTAGFDEIEVYEIYKKK